jgi:lipopolysaccharide transport system permease protein
MYFMIWRDLKSRYAQSVLGFTWAVLQPTVFMIVFTVVFGEIAKISSDGKPYAIFSYTAVVPWTLFAASVNASTNSLVGNQALLTKVYFPRAIMPLMGPISRTPDFIISMSLMVVLMIWFKQAPTVWALALPALVLIIVGTSVGLGLWLSALSVQYRDVRFALPMVVQLGLYVTPVVYPASLVPERFILIYSINPMVGVVEGFRAAILGSRAMPLDMIAVGVATTLLVLITGVFVFNRMERNFVDVI